MAEETIGKVDKMYRRGIGRLLIPGAALLLLAAQARAQFPLGFGGSQIDQGAAILADGSGGVFVAGFFRDKADFDPDPHMEESRTSKGGFDAFIARYDAAGKLVWVIAFGEAMDDAAHGLAPDGNGGIFVTGNFSGTVDFDPDEVKIANKTANGLQAIYLAHFDQNGTFIKVIDVANANVNGGRGVASDGGSGVFLTGFFHGADVDFDPGTGTTDHMDSMLDRAAFLAYYTGDLDLIWAVPIVTGKPTEGAAVAPDGEGGAYITGHFKGTAYFNPDVPADSISSTAGETDTFLARYDLSGKYVWAFNVVGSGLDYGHSVAADAQGVTITGSMQGGGFDFNPLGGPDIQATDEDAFIARYTKNRVLEWAISIDGTGDTEGFGVTYDASGGVIVTGGFSGNDVDFDPVGELKRSSNGLRDVFVARYNADKSLDWVATTGGPEGDEGSAIAISGGNVFYTGSFADKADFDPDVQAEKILLLESAGGGDVFVAGQSLGGSLVYSCAPSGSFIPVLNASDSAPCSLRRGLMEANAKTNVDAVTPDVIVFDIKPGGQKEIELKTPLPAITEAVLIDGNSQPNCTGPCIGIIGVFAGNTAGLKLTSPGSIIQGLAITLFQGPGIHLTGATAKSNVIRRSHIGVALDGSTTGGNQQGVLIDASASDNGIGGTLPGDGNIISANSGPGVTLLNAGPGNRIEGNLIGLDVSGSMKLANKKIGVLIEGTNETVVGGTSPFAANVVSGHDADFEAAGIFLKAANGTRVEGNRVGTDANGSNPVPNYTGIWLESGAANNVIGGDAPGSSNLISGNSAHGIRLFSAGPNNKVQGNRIGWNLAGNAAVGGQAYGIFLTGTEKTLIGGLQPAEGNQIAGSVSSGIYIGLGGANSTVQGNFIGAPVLGEPMKYGNNVGIFVHEGANDNLIGGLTGVSTSGPCTGACNIIHNNKGSGVVVQMTLDQVHQTAGNAIRGNSILGNGLLGIDLAQDGVTVQDADDSDGGPNGLMNYPEITSSVVNKVGGTISVGGNVIGGAPGVDLDFYLSPECDGAQHGEGAVYIGSAAIAVSNLIESFQTSFAVPADLPNGVVLTATATGLDGSTSEFSKCFSPGFSKSMNLTLKSNLQGPWKPLGGMSTSLDLDLQPTSPYGPDPTPIGPDPTPFGPDPTPIGPDPTPFIDSDGNGRIDFFEEHPEIVDWVLVKLLGGDPARPPMQVLGRTTAFLLQDGSIIDLDGESPIDIVAGNPPDDGVTRAGNPPDDNLTCYVAVFHRNHLPAMSRAMDCSAAELAYDFSTGQDQAFGSEALADLGDGSYGQYAGDLNGDGSIDEADLAEWRRRAGVSGYEGADVNLDGNVFNDDLLNFWRSNLGKMSQVPAHQ